MKMIAAKQSSLSVVNTPRDAGNGRTRLIRVAMKLFAERGFDGVTVRQLASEAGVSIGLIKHHFGSKEGLREAVDAFFLKASSAGLKRAISVTEPRNIDQMVDYASIWLSEYPEEWPVFIAYLRRAIIEKSPWGQKLFRQYFASIREMTDRLDVAGSIDPKSDRVWLPWLYFFLELGPMIFGPFIEDQLGKSIFEPEMWARFHRASQQLFWFGVGTPSIEAKNLAPAQVENE